MLTGLPKDPILLLSVVNTKLRDYYPSLDALCDDMDVSREVLEEKLGMIDYRYDAVTYYMLSFLKSIRYNPSRSLFWDRKDLL